ncbi:MAG TPA: hypothetical protein VG347_17995 [Verrucomicrobiae bacterium]|nr:hypothetical protein [Verrucomicrobiae bacterium]
MESTATTGRLLVEGGPAFNNPGKKKLAGETDWLALMPPQPAPTSATAISMAINFQLNLTC